MRTRLASLIVVKQEPLTNEYLENEQSTLNGLSQHNDVDAQFYGLADRRDSLPSQSIGDLNNNNLIHREDFIDDKKCTYYTDFVFFLFLSFPLSLSILLKFLIDFFCSSQFQINDEFTFIPLSIYRF